MCSAMTSCEAGSVDSCEDCGNSGSSGAMNGARMLDANNCGSRMCCSSTHSMFSFCDCVSYGEIGGEAYAAPVGRLSGCAMIWKSKTESLDGCELKLLEWTAGPNAGAVEEPNDSERSISGGERSEETVRRLLWGGVGWGEFAMVRRMRSLSVVTRKTMEGWRNAVIICPY